MYRIVALLKNLRIIENVKNRHTDFYFCMPKIILRCCSMQSHMKTNALGFC